MGYFEDTTIEVEVNGEKVRVAKEDAHLYEPKKNNKQKED